MSMGGKTGGTKKGGGGFGKKISGLGGKLGKGKMGKSGLAGPCKP